MIIEIMGDTIEISREGNHLFAAGKQGRTEIFAESETSFYSRTGPVKVAFLPAASDGG